MVFIDGTWLYSNLRHLAKESEQTGFFIDYGILPFALQDALERRDSLPPCDLVRTHLFGSYPVNYSLEDEERARRRKEFFTLLREDYHYEVEAFPIDYQGRKILHDDRDCEDNFCPREKCVDIALASSILFNAAIDAYDIAIAVVGDKDYYPMFSKVRTLGKRVAVVSIKQSCARIYSDRCSDKGLKDFHMIWLNDIIEKIVWKPEEILVQCSSPLHEGERESVTTMRLREGQPFFCEACRAKFAEEKAEQMAHYTAEHGCDEEHYECDGVIHHGIIENLKPDRGFGFLKRDDGASFFFHLSYLTNAEWGSLATGQGAQFTITKNPAGSKAGSAGEVTILWDEENSLEPEEEFKHNDNDTYY